MFPKGIGPIWPDLGHCLQVYECKREHLMLGAICASVAVSGES